MDEVERVGLWLGLVASVAAIVLSIVAIWFSQRVDRESRAVAEKTLAALQRIDSAVDRQSSEVTDLVKVAWNSMFGAPTGESAAGTEAGAHLRLQVGGSAAGKDHSGLAVLDHDGDSPRSSAKRTALRVREIADSLGRLSPLSVEVLRVLAGGGHLTADQYEKLREQEPEMVDELERASLLTRVKSADGEPVYWLPSGISRIVPLALTLNNQKYPEAHRRAHRVLEAIGYSSD
jgi:hypothetical protein